MLPDGLSGCNLKCRGWTNHHITLVHGQQLFYSYNWQQWRHQRVVLFAGVILQKNQIEYYPTREMRLPKCRQRVILRASVILLANRTKYYPERDMPSTNEISKIAYKY